MHPSIVRLVPLACALLAGLVAPLATHAESFASSASSAGSASVGSLSDSVHGSSKSSNGDKKVADGNYEIMEVAALAERPGMLRLRLQMKAAADTGEPDSFLLDLPQQALGKPALGAGDVVSVRNQAYGLEFARPLAAGDAQARTQTPAREPFFLVLNDDWRGDLDAHPVTF